MSWLAVAGSAHLDILAKPAMGATGLDKPGTVHLDIGGAACNIALAAAAAGEPVALLTAWNGGSYARIIERFLRGHVTLFAETNPLLGAAAFCAHLTPTGDLESAISYMPVERHYFRKGTVTRWLGDAHGVILECNLSVPEMVNLATEGVSRGLPVFVGGVSEAKCLRLTELPKGLIHTAAINGAEAAALMQHLGVADIKQVARRLGAYLLVTRGAFGAQLISPSRAKPHWCPSRVVPNEAGTLLGCGDALLARYAIAVCAGHSRTRALTWAMAQLQTIADQSSCSVQAGGAMEQAIESMDARASLDALTGLFNRRTFVERVLAECEAQTWRGALLFVDLDHFKRVNDTYGHAAGDEVLKAVANYLKTGLRGTDFAGRWGGEEFVVCVTAVSLDDARLTAERLRVGVQRLSGLPVAPTASVGLAFRQVDELFEQWVARADTAVYAAKRMGRNRVVSAEALPPATVENGA